jgi:threonylcarbamoyladenosine tRNA methylthiotransferase CDKAL1
MKAYLETFGCTFNQADSQIMAGLLMEQEITLVSQPEDADLIIINTCYVKHATEQRVVHRIYTLQQEFPSKKFIIAGCMVEIDQHKLKTLAPSAGWIGPHRIESTPYVVKSILNGNMIRLTGSENITKVNLPKIRFNPLIDIIQICEGCDGICSYCCTRTARGNLRSYTPKLIKQEAERAIKEGCVELQLTAQDSAAYGKDTGDSLSALINTIIDIAGDFRVRIGMMHPKSIIDDVDELIKAYKNYKVYKFLHIPLQSGNNTVLNDMNRGHLVQDFREIITAFRTEFPQISIATDVIVGYPTEDENAFQDTLELIREVHPDFLHISKYHHRPGAPSSLLDEIEHFKVKDRSKRLNTLKSEISHKNNEKLLGKTLDTIITGKGSKGGFIGRTNSYKTVIVKDATPGSIVKVEITEARATYLKGVLVN